MIKVSEDNLFIDDSGPWAARKYKLVKYYSNLFATSMKNKWDNRIYIDLYSSSGYTRIKGTNEIVMTSPLIAASVDDKFDKYIFCEIDSVKIDALEKRMKRDFDNINKKFINADVNLFVNQIIEEIPTFSKEFTGITLCLVDPYKIDNFAFKTILSLSFYKIDFLILIPSYMDVNRNEKNYIDEHSTLVTKFLDNPNWRDEWDKLKLKGFTFGTFIVKAFNDRMIKEGFLGLNNDEFILIRNPQNNSPLYHLAFYSKNKLGKKFWNNARKATSDQLEFF